MTADAEQSMADGATSGPLPDGTGRFDFEIARGGPYFELQQRLGLLQKRALNSGRRAAIAVALAWGVPLLLSLAAGTAWGPAASRPFLLDAGVWARYAVAIAIFILMERTVEERLRLMLRRIATTPLVAPAQLPAAAAAVERALRRRDSASAELCCVVLGYAITIGAATMLLSSDQPSAWLATGAVEGKSLTVAGWWSVLVSNPLYWFLLLRWLWRHLVWALLMREMARLDLRLVATHPDGYGGIAFIAEYPNAFAAFVFALSCVVGAATLQALLHGTLGVSAFKYVMGIWLAIVLLLFALPLLAFSRPLRSLKQDTIRAYAVLATRHDRAAERDMLGHNVAAPDADEGAEGEKIPDPTKTYAVVRKLGTMPGTKSALLPIGVAALLPLVAVGATQLPFKELLKIAKGFLL